jgi:NAD(P)H-dependent FMN reductase
MSLTDRPSLNDDPTAGPALRIGVVVGSTRPGRRAEQVAAWAHRQAARRSDATFAVLDLVDFALPLLDEPVPAAMGEPARDHTRRWAAAVGACDGFVFVLPEYNRSLPAALKNAIDFVYSEWQDKAAGCVAYGVHGGIRAAEHLRQVLAEVGVAAVRTAVALTLAEDFADGRPVPREHHERHLDRMLDELVRWSCALRLVRRT